MTSSTLNRAMGSHQSASMMTDTWLTPPSILHALGEFDLDPCTPPLMPWLTAKKRYTEQENGLIMPWFGRVWLNPPYGKEASKWLFKLRNHGNGIALVFARTETKMFFDHVWPFADSIFFFEGRLFFCDTKGVPAKANSGAPSVLIAYGENNSDAIADSGLRGIHLPVNRIPVVVVGVSPSWSAVVRIAVNRLNGVAAVNDVYGMVELIAPDKVKRNKHYKEKVRQKLQEGFKRVAKGFYKRVAP